VHGVTIIPGVDDPTRAPSAAERACAWGGAGAFVASLLYFLFSYDVTFVKAVDSPAGLGAIVWNVALFSVFALHHSLFARSGIRDAIQRRWPRIERSLYVWVASLLLVITCAFWRPVGGDVWLLYGWPAIFLRLLHLGGIVLAVGSAAAIDIWELSGVKQITDAGSEDRAHTEAEFKTTGPYGLVRHPIYSGWFLLVFAVPHMTMTRLVFAVVSSVYVLIAIPLEERSLVASSAGAYDRYKGKVRFRLVPGVY
jgi:protein-S-isoprenylcysteine O-methyltransferase Ste14